MNHAARVRVAERVAERDADPSNVTVRKLARDEPLTQRFSADHLGDEIDRFSVTAGFVEGDYSRVVKPRSGDRLTLGSRRHLRIMGLDPFHSHDAVEPLVQCQPDDAKGAGAEAPHQPISLKHNGRRDLALRRRIKLNDCSIDGTH